MWAAFDDNRQIVRASWQLLDVTVTRGVSVCFACVGEGIHIQESSGVVQLKEN